MPSISIRDLQPEGDVELCYESYGAGAPLLVIGGLGLTVAELRPLTRQLARSVRVVAFDNRGTGASAAPRVPYSIEQMARDAAALLDGLEIPRTHVLGISLGGRIALELALAEPRRVERLVLVSTSARVIRRRRVRLGMLLSRLPGLRGRQPQAPYAQKAQYEASRRYDATSRLAELAQPTLIIHGRRDHVVPVRMAEELHAGIAGSRLELIEGGHLASVMPRGIAAVCAAVVPFLAGSGPGGAR